MITEAANSQPLSATTLPVNGRTTDGGTSESRESDASANDGISVQTEDRHHSFPSTSTASNTTSRVSLSNDLTNIRRFNQPLLDSYADGTMKRRTYRTLPLSEEIPVISVSSLLNLPTKRSKRQTRIRPIDEFPDTTYGDPIIQKRPKSTRLFFQNAKGLTHTASGDDYFYYPSMSAYQVDVFGLAETNTCWKHHHLTSDFRQTARKHFRQNRISFGSPSSEVDPCMEKEKFQAEGGGSYHGHWKYSIVFLWRSTHRSYGFGSVEWYDLCRPIIYQAQYSHRVPRMQWINKVIAFG
jgi:hypothetical protein